MRSFINYFIKYPIAGNLIMVLLFAAGIFGMTSMKSTFFPETESRTISIQAVSPGASPEEIEEGIVLKIEENLKGLTGIEQISSVSSENAGNITVEVLQGYDTDIILQDVKNAVDRISSFPAAMEPPVIYKREALGFAISFALSGDVDLRTLKQFGRQVEDELLALDGISKVGLSGFPEEEIEISFRESALQAYQVTFAQATQAVRASNLEITGGKVKGAKEELLIRAKNKKYYAEELRNIVVKTNPNGSVVRLHQLADIKDQWAENPSRSFMNGAPSVVVNVQNTLEEDMLSIAGLVRDYIEEFNERDLGVKATIVRDSSITLNQRINLLAENGIVGFTLVVILLAIFLNWRLAFWVALSIPISFAGMFMVCYALGTTINVISLFGMILVIGILVDDGIVIAESIYQKHEQGMPRMEAAIEGVMSVLPAVISAILTTIIAFSAFFFIKGRLGDIFAEMSIVVIWSLIFSLVEGAIILPAHVAHSKALDKESKPNKLSQGLDALMNFLRDKLYAPVLKFAMYNKALMIAFIFGSLLVVIGGFRGGFIQATFFPNLPTDNINVSLKMPTGTREYITESWLDKLEKVAWEVNEEFKEEYFADEKSPIVKVEKKIGPNPFEGGLDITLLDGESRGDLTARMVSSAIREKAGPIPDAEVLSFGGRSVFGKPVSVSLLGNNYQELQGAVNGIADQLKDMKDLKDVVTNDQEGLKEINLSLKEKALFLGLNLQEVVSQVRQGFFGSEVQRLQRGVDEVRVWVRYDQSDRNDITKLKNMRIRFADGREFPLHEIADFEIERGVISINHLDGKREIKIEADVADDDVSVSDITTELVSNIVPTVLKDYPSVVASFEGQNKSQKETQESMQVIMPVIFILMFFVIALTFRSISQTLVVFALIPFGLVGVGMGHYLMGMPVSLFSILGVIALIGILVNDALVFVTTYNNLLKDGVKQMDAVYQAGVSRFRPILLTSVTTIAGLTPLMFEKSFQAQFLIPVAVSVAFGLLLVTFIILILLPVLLIWTNRIKVWSANFWEGEKFAYEQVEPAVAGRVNYFFLWLIAGALSLGGFFAVVMVIMQITGMFT